MSVSHLASTRITLSRRVALVVAVAFAATAVATLAHPEPAFAWDQNAFSSAAEHQLVALTNQSRASAGRRSLRISATLSSIARWRSRDMVKRDYFSHSIPGYGNVFKKISASGFCYHLAGENIGWTSASDSGATAQIHKMFMGSSGHRANILGKAWDAIGVGAYKAPDGRKMYTVLFADKCGSAKASTSRPKTKPRPNQPRQPKPAHVVAKPTAIAKALPIATLPPMPEPTPVALDASVVDRAEPSDALPGDTARAAPTASEPPIVAATAANRNAVADDGHGLRVTVGSAPPGLLETIVGGLSDLAFGR